MNDHYLDRARAYIERVRSSFDLTEESDSEAAAQLLSNTLRAVADGEAAGSVAEQLRARARLNRSKAKDVGMDDGSATHYNALGHAYADAAEEIEAAATQHKWPDLDGWWETNDYPDELSVEELQRRTKPLRIHRIAEETFNAARAKRSPSCVAETG